MNDSDTVIKMCIYINVNGDICTLEEGLSELSKSRVEW